MFVRPGTTKTVPKDGTYFIWARGSKHIKIGMSKTGITKRLRICRRIVLEALSIIAKRCTRAVAEKT